MSRASSASPWARVRTPVGSAPSATSPQRHACATDSDAQGAGALHVRYGAGDLVEMRKVDRVPGYMRYDNERNT